MILVSKGILLSLCWTYLILVGYVLLNLVILGQFGRSTLGILVHLGKPIPPNLWDLEIPWYFFQNKYLASSFKIPTPTLAPDPHLGGHEGTWGTRMVEGQARTRFVQAKAWNPSAMSGTLKHNFLALRTLWLCFQGVGSLSFCLMPLFIIWQRLLAVGISTTRKLLTEWKFHCGKMGSQDSFLKVHGTYFVAEPCIVCLDSLLPGKATWNQTHIEKGCQKKQHYDCLIAKY